MIYQTDKRINLNDNSFEAGGVKYLIHGNLDIERFQRLEEMEVRARFGANFISLHNRLTEIWELLNTHKYADAIVKLHNCMQGTVRQVSKQTDPLLLICTLFCRPEGDTQAWSEELANERVKAWSAEGYPAEDFFALGLQFVKHYHTILQPDTPPTLEEDSEAQ